MQEEGTNEELELDESLFAETEETAEQQEAPNVQEQKVENVADDVPEKYRGKSAMEIIRMHQDAERLIGKQGNEVGELRRIVNDIVAKTEKAQPSEAPQPEPDFFEDPVGASARAAKKVYESDTELQEMKKSVKEMQQEAAAAALLRRHPDAVQISNDPKFGEWVSKSDIRRNLFMQAHQNFDHKAASELFDLYKDSKVYEKEVSQAATQERQKAVKQAATGSGKASAESRRAPVLSSDAIIEMRIKDPAKYERLLPVLKKAYAEGRVK